MHRYIHTHIHRDIYPHTREIHIHTCHRYTYTLIHRYTHTHAHMHTHTTPL